MTEPIVALSDLTKRYGDLIAVQELSFDLERGKSSGFLGANGAGKTTTMRMLCGLVRPTAGKATIEGADTWRDRYAGAGEIRLHGAKIQPLSGPDRAREHAFLRRRLPGSA